MGFFCVLSFFFCVLIFLSCVFLPKKTCLSHKKRGFPSSLLYDFSGFYFIVVCDLILTQSSKMEFKIKILLNLITFRTSESPKKSKDIYNFILYTGKIAKKALYWNFDLNHVCIDISLIKGPKFSWDFWKIEGSWHNITHHNSSWEIMCAIEISNAHWSLTMAVLSLLHGSSPLF